MVTASPAPLHIGILGHSPEGAALCWTEACRHSVSLGYPAHADLTMDCISFQHAMPAWNVGDYAAVREILTVSARRLAAAGAEFFVCPDNTAHLALEAAGPDLPLPGLHIVDIVAEAARRNGYRRVAVLGTRFTMEGPLYPRELARRGVVTVVPDDEDRTMVDSAIFAELVHGRVTPLTRRRFHELVARLQRRHGCDAVAAACTEIPLALTSEDSPLPLLDSTRLLGRAAAEVARGLRPLPTWRGGEVNRGTHADRAS